MLKPPPFSEQDTNESIKSIKSIDLSVLCTGLLEPEGERESVVSDEAACWGGKLKDDHSECTPGFFTGQAHFKNKFCQNCRRHLAVRRHPPSPRPASLDRKLR